MMDRFQLILELEQFNECGKKTRKVLWSIGD